MWFRSSPNELFPGYGDWQMAQMHVLSHISASNILPLPESISLLFFSQTCVPKSLKQDTEAPEGSNGHLHIFKLVDLFKLNPWWWPAVGSDLLAFLPSGNCEGEHQQGQKGSRQMLVDKNLACGVIL